MSGELPIPRELNLLLTCVRGRPDSEAIRSAVQEGIHWDRFVALAETHGFSSLSCRRLDDACPEIVPPDARAALGHHLQRDSERNLFLTAELFRILARLSDGGVRALAFKGPVLAWWLYGHPGMRRFQDLDILVDRGDVERAIQLLRPLGFSTNQGGGGKPKLVASIHEIELYRNAPPATIDLHWDLAPPAMGLALNLKCLLPRAANVLVAGRPVPTFGAEDQILFCAFHGAKHAWGRLVWLADFSALLETCQPDWPLVLAEARRKHLSRALFTAMHLARALLGTPVPAELQKALDRDRDAAAIASKARSSLLSETKRESLFPRELGFHLGITEGCSRKIGYLWHRITEPTMEDSELARSVRPFRLMRKYAYRLAGLR